jgi:hypothetical protein
MTTGSIVNVAWVSAAEVDLEPSDNHASAATIVGSPDPFKLFLPLVLK